MPRRPRKTSQTNLVDEIGLDRALASENEAVLKSAHERVIEAIRGGKGAREAVAERLGCSVRTLTRTLARVPGAFALAAGLRAARYERAAA
jgi:hypothetical protein